MNMPINIAGTPTGITIAPAKMHPLAAILLFLAENTA